MPRKLQSFAFVLALVSVTVSAALGAVAADYPVKDTSSVFSGAKVTVGYVTRTTNGPTVVLTLSDDFKVPETPDPHWQVVDADGRVFLLNRLMIKDDKLNKTITVPAYVGKVVKVQIWCAFAEVLLGEATFAPQDKKAS